MEHSNHITHYRTHAVILVILLFLTALTITVTWIDTGHQAAIVVAMVVACIKAGFVMFYFMHLKFDILLFRILVGLVFLLLVVVFVITFFDYLFR
jgi:cytochrome c oxidase subunit IV